MSKQAKVLILHGDRRTSVTLEPEFWDCIDLAASMRGLKWTDWAREVLKDREGDDGVTATLRVEAMKQIKFAYLFGNNRSEDLATADQNKLTKNHGMLTDEQLEQILSTSQIRGESDFGGFSIIFGFDEHGRDFLAVKNNLSNHPHFMTTLD